MHFKHLTGVTPCQEVFSRTCGVEPDEFTEITEHMEKLSK